MSTDRGNLVRKLKEGDRLELNTSDGAVELELVRIRGTTQIVLNVRAPKVVRIRPMPNVKKPHPEECP